VTAPFHPNSSGTSVECEFVFAGECGGGAYNLGPESARALESWESVMTRGLSQRIETKESFIRGGVRLVLGAGSWAAGEHSEVVRKQGGFAGVK